MATKRRRAREVTPASRPLRRLARAALEQQFAAALEAREGVAGAHCINELWMRNEPPMNVERMIEQLWWSAPESVPEWLPLGYRVAAGRYGYILDVHGEEVRYDLDAPLSKRDAEDTVWSRYLEARLEVARLLLHRDRRRGRRSRRCASCACGVRRASRRRARPMT